ncbi:MULTISPECIES: DUF1471 domain-containing protein [unclassified Klebsiella]|uniref:DUF1471 domain-containing protein n=1 Tax=Enterobacteriaceae TaxID=543 RepID=UPI0015DC3AFF|nr:MULTISPECIES: DUF1471 domain-containing protein [unclassified Klebsiella]HAT3953380.1 DUF1471 domain-containing protein [Kluyvera ascorbata]BBR58113.1 hypothetical protein WP4W18E05_14810 [Klebsiella sp. WP4-W18-ESBL-05]BBS92634.1 hypothetical protein WP7S18C02_32490 [Klebsiella sp. WP7-S18-CRE-02]BBS97663.1 hypothetical protein WP7S18C03_32560 [Klebsiella sp. WP7-S18-CRE-03]BBT02730.1 hypothetical protein WP7S18E04_32920 [Klebsiella sp. WP7-S18-ESBL-04]
MHTFHLLFAAALLATTTVCAQSAPAPGVPFRPVGTVTASGASNLDDLQQQLAKKAHEAGAIAFVVDVAGGKNKLFGSATLYR